MHLTSAQATAHFPAADVARFRTLVATMATSLHQGDQAGLNTAVDAYEKAWDQDESQLKPLNTRGWNYIDSQNDAVFTSVRETKDPASEGTAIHTLQSGLG